MKTTTITVGAYTYHLVEYAYVTADTKDYIGRHKSPNLKFAGELKEITPDYEWLTPLTAIERAPLGDTFAMEGYEGEAYDTRYELLKQLKEEEELERYRNIKPGWQPFKL